MSRSGRRASGRRTSRSIRRFLRRRDGQGLVEFAIVIPLLLFLFFGVIEFGRYYTTRLTLRHSVREAARFAVTGNVLRDSTGQDLPRGESIRTVIAQSASFLNIDPSEVDLSPADGGEPGQLVRVDVRHGFRFVVPIISRLFPSQNLEIHVSTVMRNEEF